MKSKPPFSILTPLQHAKLNMAFKFKEFIRAVILLFCQLYRFIIYVIITVFQ